jgi:thiopeptide-type bacteriocin biosynthesis protein
MTLRMFLDSTNPLLTRVTVGSAEISMAEFLTSCLGTESRPKLESEDLRPVRRAFLEAGLAAIEMRVRNKWVQFGIEITDLPASPDIYNRMTQIVSEMFAEFSISNFFFMHKPPGLRLRFETTTAGQFSLSEYLHDRLLSCQREGLISGIVPGIYEPETYLFGGAVSMISVHKLFTIDSLAWLQYHALPSEVRDVSGPSWALSLMMVRPLLDGLNIMDWEDLDVWDRIRQRTGRSLPDEILDEADFVEAAAGIRSRWHNPHMLLEDLPTEVRKLFETYQSDVLSATAHWQSEYFKTRDAIIGPREAAALLIIFHWNRAALSLPRQSLLTEALLRRATV